MDHKTSRDESGDLLRSADSGRESGRTSDQQLPDILLEHARDILQSEGLQSEKAYRQHGDVSCYDHSIAVTLLSVRLARWLPFKFDMRSLVRGALLHDYFLYDWHEADKSHRLHGFIHARRALENAERDFTLTPVERDIILKHMFPLNPRPPRYKESFIVILADRICATREILASVGARGKRVLGVENDSN